MSDHYPVYVETICACGAVMGEGLTCPRSLRERATELADRWEREFDPGRAKNMLAAARELRALLAVKEDGQVSSSMQERWAPCPIHASQNTNSQPCRECRTVKEDDK